MSQSTSQTWDATHYDNAHSFVWRLGEVLVDRLAAQPGEKILDLGCGTGHLTAQIARSSATVIGLDASPEMIAAASAAYPSQRFVLADGRALATDKPFAAGTFDAIFSNAALHWVPQPDLVAQGMARVLRSGGRLVAEFGGHGNVSIIRGAIGAARIALGLAPRQNALYFPRLGEYCALLETAGFEVLEAQLFDRPTPLTGAAGIFEWAQQFEAGSLTDVRPEQWAAFRETLEQKASALRAADGTWVADYRRLRIIAHTVGK